MTYFSNSFRPYLFVILWLVFTACLQWLGKGYFRYENDLMSSLEIWRLLTAHWVHLNWVHWLLNNMGLIMLVALTRIRWSFSFWLKIIIVHSVLISLALYLLNSHLNWYVGFSGCLYGLFMLAAIVQFKKDKIMSALIMIIITAKIGAEQLIGSDISSESLLGAPVVVDAHAYGYIIGTILGVLTLMKLIKIK